MLDRKVFDVGMVYFFARYPSAKAEEQNLAAWYEDIRDELTDQHFGLVLKWLAKNHQYQSWQNFGGIILDTAKSIRLEQPKAALSIEEHVPPETLAERKRLLAEARDALAMKFGSKFRVKA